MSGPRTSITSETCITSRSAATRGITFLPDAGRGRDQRVVGAGERDDQRGERLGEPVLQRVGLREQHLRDAGELRRLRRDAGAPLAGDQHMHVAAELCRRGDGLRRRLVQARIVVLGENQASSSIFPQNTPASVFSLSSSSATEATFTPACRFGGSRVSTISSRGVVSTPKSAAVFVSIGFFFAFMMFGSEA